MLSSGDLGAHVGQLARTKVNAAMTTEPTAVAPSVDAATAALLMLLIFVVYQFIERVVGGRAAP
jgi:hypothetical protein